MKTVAALYAVGVLVSSAAGDGGPTTPDRIDRHALVSRHNVVLTAFDAARPLSVGNGEFAFNMDITGLQTFVPFNTMSHWGWHVGAPPRGTKPEDYQEQPLETHGRQIPYALPDPNHPELSLWLSSSPHRVNLARVGLVLTRNDGSPATEADLRSPRQELDLWRGIVTSRFEFEGASVIVQTTSHPAIDAIGVRIDSPLIEQGRLGVFLACPGNNPLAYADYVGDWSNPGRFEPVGEPRDGRADFRRQLDEHVTFASLVWRGEATLLKPEITISTLEIVAAQYGGGDRWLDVTEKVAAGVRDGMVAVRVGNALGADPAPGVRKSLKVTYKVDGAVRETVGAEGAELIIDASPSRRRVTLLPSPGSKQLEFVCAFSPKSLPRDLPDVVATFEAAETHWAAYWESGGAIDLSESSDPRWRELERRIVLSQYLMAVHEAGSLPPQESGLVNNGWYGRFHMEMVWWHAAHWALWDRWAPLDRNMGIYGRLLPEARERATRQGYRGARWPKCIGPDGWEWPHEIHSLLIWQQPHPIFFAELEYRARPTRETLEKWRDVVEASADFMASYAHRDPASGRFVLGPPIHIASENAPPLTTRNPTFELGYWRFGLRVAQEWRKRLGSPQREEWDEILRGLSPLPVQDGVYVAYEGVEEMWTKMNFDHPALVGTFGMLPGDGVDVPTMKRTLQRVASEWDFERTWGWDFPMLAMTAARLGEPELAIKFLLHPSADFHFDECGLATGGPYPYFPSNGGLLYAAAMMAEGWEGAVQQRAPGFPNDGAWKVRYEGLRRAP